MVLLQDPVQPVTKVFILYRVFSSSNAGDLWCVASCQCWLLRSKWKFSWEFRSPQMEVTFMTVMMWDVLYYGNKQSALPRKTSAVQFWRSRETDQNISGNIVICSPSCCPLRRWADRLAVPFSVNCPFRLYFGNGHQLNIPLCSQLCSVIQILFHAVLLFMCLSRTQINVDFS